MAKHWPLLVALLLAASANAQQQPELSAIVFRAAPLSSEQPPAPANRIAQESVRRAPSPGTDRQRSPRTTPSDELSADIAKHLAALDEEEARSGERSPTLIDPLQSLAALYQDAGNDDAAIAALQKAVWILRVNSGLFSLDQVDVVEDLLAARRANGQHSDAATLEGYLQQLATRNPEDVRVSGLLARLADAEMASARDLVDVPPPPRFNVVLNGEIPRPLELRSPALKALLAGRRHYAEAMLAGIRNRSESFADLMALEDRLIGTLYFELAHPRLRYYEDGPTRSARFQSLASTGTRMLYSRIDNIAKLRQSPVATAAAMIELGDWYLIFGVNGAALEQYQAARDLLVSQGVSQTTIDEIVSPEMPPILPALLQTPERSHHGYVDAEIEVGPYGNTRDVDVLATSPNTAKIIEKRLRQYLERSRIRPRFVDGHLVRSDRFSARFYYEY